jgi:hypothetical protein
MPLTVLSKGCFCEVEYLFEILLIHNDDDSFVFRLLYNGVRYRVHIYGDYSYMVILPAKPTPNIHNYDHIIETVEYFVETFLDFCLTVKRERIYNWEQEIGHHLLITFGAHMLDWHIWYAFFSKPYPRLRLLSSYDVNGDEIWHFFQQLKIVHTE